MTPLPTRPCLLLRRETSTPKGSWFVGPNLAWRSSDGVEVYERLQYVYVSHGGQVQIPTALRTLGVLLGTPCTDVPIDLRRETAGDRTLKSVSLTREVQTGDLDFDAEVFIDTEASDATVHAILASPDVRAAVRSLLRLSTKVEIHAGEVRLATWVGEVQYLQALAETLTTLPRLLAATGGSPYRAGDVARPIVPAPSRLFPRFVIGLAVSLGVLCCLVTLSSEGVTTLDHRAAILGTLSGAFLWMVGTVLGALVLRGRTRSLHDLAPVTIALLALVLCGGSLAKKVNAAYDTGPATVRQATLQVARSPKSGLFFVLKTPEGDSFFVNVKVVRGYKEGDTVPATFTTRPGLWSEWVVRVDAPDKPTVP